MMNSKFGREYVNSWISAEKTYRRILDRLNGFLSR